MRYILLLLGLAVAVQFGLDVIGTSDILHNTNSIIIAEFLLSLLCLGVGYQFRGN